MQRSTDASARSPSSFDVAATQPPEEAQRRQAGPREERVAELPDVEAEARVVALVRVVHVVERAVEHVVEDEPVGERAPVAHVHRDVPGIATTRIISRPRDDLELRDLADDPLQAREQLLAGARRAEVREGHEHRQAEARGALAERRHRREEPGGEVVEAPRCAARPSSCRAAGRGAPPRAGPCSAGSKRREGAPHRRAEAVGRRCRPSAGCSPDTSSWQSSLPGRPQLPPPEPLRNSSQCGRKPCAPAVPEELEVAREEIEDLRHRADEDRPEDQVPARQPPARARRPSPRRRAPRGPRACADR